MRHPVRLAQLASLSVLFLSSAATLTAQTTTTPTIATFDAAPFASTIDELHAASSAVPTDHAYDVQILLEEGIYRIADDGTLDYRHRMIYRIDSAAAIENWSEISADWDPWYEKPAQLHARVLQTDGHFVELDQKTITDAPVKADDDETFSSAHVRRAPLPGISVGAIIEETEEVEEKTPYFSGGSLYHFAFRQNVPMARSRVIVDLPATLPYKDAVHHLPTLAINRSAASGRRHIVYELTSIPALHGSDIELETNTPDTPMVEFATGASWKAVASAYATLSDPQTLPADAQTILPANLPSDRMERIRAIVARLHQEVRYTGVEFGAARLTPQRPSEVIQRHYGDCKDKATLLVAMLRAANIPANLALLSVGPGIDVSPDLPGMNQFDHAIVYVPKAGTEPALWIDATASLFLPGTLPFGDEGRMALVIAPETTALLRTTDPSPQESTLVETRTFTLAEKGPAHVVETSDTTGSIDANYRSIYGGTDTNKIHQNLEGYVQNSYLAKTLTKVTHGDPEDLSHPFHLSLEIDGARRGDTEMNEALVVVFPSFAINSLPRWFSVPPPVVGPDTPAETRHQLDLAQQSRAPGYIFHPFLDERRVRIVIPEGFVLRSLPPNKTTQLGSAVLTETYSDAEPGVITASFHFDSGSGVLTTDQALAMRSAVLEFNKRDYVGIYFDQVGAKALAEGHIRAALDADRALIAAHPSNALHHVRLSTALLEAGIGDGARAEARRAIELDPKSSVAFLNLGWTLQHDSLGVQFGKGFDLAGAIAAYKQAIALDPDDDDPRFDLAVLYEFGPRGVRYADDSNLTAAIAQYRELIERTKDKNPAANAQDQDNLLYALLYAKQYVEVDRTLATLPFTNIHAVLSIVSAVAQHGAAAGIAQADKGNAASADRNRNLLAAGSLLAELRLYPEASEVLKAGIATGSDAPTTARQIEMYRTLHPASLAPLPASDPAAPMQSLTLGMFAGTLTHDAIAAALSHHSYTSDAAFERDVQKTLLASGSLRPIARADGTSEVVLLDYMAGNLAFSSSGDDATGHPILVQTPGGNPMHSFVVRENGVYRIVGGDADSSNFGNAVLFALAHNNPKQAKAILDWRRDLLHKAGGDDAFAGPIFPRFWTVDSSKPDADSPAAMRLAAISLLAGSMDAKPYLAELAEDREKASGQHQTDLDLLLAYAATGAEQPAVALPAAKRLLDQEPDSQTALELLGQTYALQGESTAWLAMLAPRLEKRPQDHDLLEEQVRAYESAHNYAAARKSAQAVLDSGKATANDYNSFAWLGLFDQHLGEEELKAAQQANMHSKNSSFAELHTLACIYAAEGRTTEARQVLDQAMTARSQTEPDSEVWFALGLIYEQYGARDAALSAYRKVQAHELDDHTYIDPMSTYLLAQSRITALSAAGK
jgi:tetratricopeptide (TPR) repeat protein